MRKLVKRKVVKRVPSRKAIAAKTNGCCAYCGTLLKPGWQRDHRVPLIRYRGVKWSFGGYHGCKNPEAHTFENIFAACRVCNKDKGALDVETWRASLKWPGWQKGVVFYFEKLQGQQ
jgi:5-methylcytosine-specific restriction endonuclease McrA